MPIISLLRGWLVPDWGGVRTFLYRIRPAGIDITAQRESIEQ